ncbi:type II toxin-antitoxin system RelE/ParE family toxin [Mycoplana dimorpha]|uniref:ParE-like toxin of type II ParDE toxin-antitoxin system n=1 Tax=Mycoplana dimorpha TaxID=28320 RepID=A0A2T5B5Q4_MYCDI|nr:type II toxin-antitoxin system RelE/ParE family toxin [Mycoplana dimorpha]PTM94306.1 ParE-like toxin of type II ParDE toxin-antitoxin system [Mycoplana dimorpha]
MEIVYLPSAVADLQWMRLYYSRVFPQGARRARQHLLATERLLADNPYAGEATGIADVREFPIRRTPFSIIYRVRSRRLEILRVWDQRGDPHKLGF